jgi:Pyruvate/2-oxoacid:ferredoxin oxidoreductase gamma subunit
VEHPQVLVAMNEPSLRKFAAQVAADGLVLYNRDALPAGFSVPQARVYCVPASETADRLGAAKAANMVMLGALLELTHALPAETALAVLQTKVRNAALLEINRHALDAGAEHIRKAIPPAVLTTV